MGTATMAFEHPVEEWFVGPYSLIPEHMQEALRRYVIDRVMPGDFLQAVITNDLRGSFARADDENAKLVGLYVRWFHNIPPASCSGSKQNMANWLKNTND